MNSRDKLPPPVTQQDEYAYALVQELRAINHGLQHLNRVITAALTAPHADDDAPTDLREPAPEPKAKPKPRTREAKRAQAKAASED